EFDNAPTVWCGISKNRRRKNRADKKRIAEAVEKRQSEKPGSSLLPRKGDMKKNIARRKHDGRCD
ncbi:MAG: hypothetical protein ACOC3A_12790, partial [Thermodesulfobacteriota bacterium]